VSPTKFEWVFELALSAPPAHAYHICAGTDLGISPRYLSAVEIRRPTKDIIVDIKKIARTDA